MATFFLINNIRIGSQKLYAGSLIDDGNRDVRKIRGAGGVLIPSSNASIAAAATLAQKMRRRGVPEQALSDVMEAALGYEHEVFPKGPNISATATVQWSDGLRRVITGLAANATITLGVAAGADGRLPVAGKRWQFTRTDTGAFTVAFVNGGPGAGTLKTLAVSVIGFAEFEFDGTNWELVQ